MSFKDIVKSPYLYASVSIVLWSTTATVTKILLDGISSIQILMLSSLISFLFLLIVNLCRKKVREILSYSIKDFLIIAGIGVMGTFLYNYFLYLGVDYLQASQAFTINYLWPIMTIVFGCIILKENLNLKIIIAVLLSFLGVIVVATNGDLANLSDGGNLLGVLFCVLAALSYGLFAVLVKKVEYDKFVSMMLYYLTSCIVANIFGIATNQTFIPNTNQILGILWIGIFTSAIAFTSWALALAKGNTAKISNLAYITPFLSLIWTAIVLHEEITIFSLVGLVMIVVGILIQSHNKRHE